MEVNGTVILPHLVFPDNRLNKMDIFFEFLEMRGRGFKSKQEWKKFQKRQKLLNIR
jgi:hypothetical protein